MPKILRYRNLNASTAVFAILFTVELAGDYWLGRWRQHARGDMREDKNIKGSDPSCPSVPFLFCVSDINGQPTHRIMAARNPSPPPISGEEAIIFNSDTIENTVFSKAWVLRTLFKLTELTEAIKSNEDSPNTECKKAKSEDNLDGELCKLWDMSMNAVRCVLKLLMVRMCKYHAILFLNKTMGKQKLPMMALYIIYGRWVEKIFTTFDTYIWLNNAVIVVA